MNLTTVTYEDYSRRVNRFMRIAEDADKLPAFAFLTQIAQAAADLCSGILGLPDDEPETDVDRTAGSLVFDEPRAPIFSMIREKLGSADGYWEVFDSTQKDEPVMASLADDIGDTYHDLKKGLRLAERGASPSEVIHEWRSLFYIHWGYHAAGAVRAIYWLLRDRWHNGLMDGLRSTDLSS